MGKEKTSIMTEMENMTCRRKDCIKLYVKKETRWDFERGEYSKERMEFINCNRKHTCCPALSVSLCACVCILDVKDCVL